MKAVQHVRHIIEYVMVPLTREERKRQQELAAAIAALNDDTKRDSKEHEQAKGKIKKLLEQSFDEDMAARKEQLDQLEKKVKQLRASFDKRTEARDEIVQHRLRGLELDADGLSFPGPAANPWRSTQVGPVRSSLAPSGPAGPGVQPDVRYIPPGDPNAARPIPPADVPLERSTVGP